VTVTGYRLLLALLALVLFTGVILAAPRPAELGVTPTLSCEQWFRSPAPSGPVRLEGCVVDLDGHAYDERLDGRGVEVALVKVRPPGWSPSEEAEPAGVLWRTDDPSVLAVVDRGRRASDESAYNRFVERYDAEVLRVRPIVGAISTESSQDELREMLEAEGEIAPRPWIIDGTSRSPVSRASGLVLFTFALLSIALIVWLQRRWDRRRLALTGKAAPMRF
jgi:hypothetical protein